MEGVSRQAQGGGGGGLHLACSLPGRAGMAARCWGPTLASAGARSACAVVLHPVPHLVLAPRSVLRRQPVPKLRAQLAHHPVSQRMPGERRSLACMRRRDVTQHSTCRRPPHAGSRPPGTPTTATPWRWWATTTRRPYPTGADAQGSPAGWGDAMLRTWHAPSHDEPRVGGVRCAGLARTRGARGGASRATS